MTEPTSSAQLLGRVATMLGGRHPVFAAAAVRPGQCIVAVNGANEDADFEIASISKGITGLLYADAIERGEITAEHTLGDLLPLGDVPAAAVTVGSLSTHRSGLPRLPASAEPLRRTIALWRYGANPYGETLEQLLDQARGVEVGKPRPSYSNFGFELLGHAVASAAGMSYADLVDKRLAAPLGLRGLYVPATPDELRPTAIGGYSKRRKAQEPWTGEAIGPAGGIRATITDLARLITALLDRTAPGVSALDPIADFGRGTRIGAGWLTITVRGREITWHNGGSGGFRSWLGLDRAAGTGAVIVSATAASVDRHGFDLLSEASTTTSD